MKVSLRKKIYPLGIILTVSPLFISCDGSSPEDALTEKLPDEIDRGLNISEIKADPTGTPNFPTFLLPNETITFIPLTQESNGTPFLDQIPLGTWSVQSSGFLRQADSSGSSIYYPINENSFTYEYTSGNSSSSGENTQGNASITYTSNHTVALSEFTQRLAVVQAASNTPGSLGYALSTTNEDFLDTILLAGESTDDARDRIYVDAISSVGIPAVDNVVDSDDPGDTTRVWARIERSITLSDIVSTNADLDSSSPSIIGTYRIEDRWDAVSDFGGQLNILVNSPIDYEIYSGTFILRINQL